MTTALRIFSGTLSRLIPHPANAIFVADLCARHARTRRLAGAFGALLLFSAATGVRAAHAQTAPVSDSVVVTATLSPEEERNLGSATTVITRREIESKGATTVLELLREVPGLDVARQGGDGSLTSVFLRGTNSTQALVLVDGARVNSPFFSGYDFSALTTENVERIEIVRGPFSALYGSAYREDGTVNMETAERMGWTKRRRCRIPVPERRAGRPLTPDQTVLPSRTRSSNE
jgi:outer membrane cobalamin receptor